MIIKSYMVKKTIHFIFLSLCVCTTYSQTSNKYGINFRLSNAKQIRDYKIQIPDKTIIGNSISYGFGLFYKFQKKEYFFIQPQINYLQRVYSEIYQFYIPQLNRYSISTGNIQKLEYISLDVLTGISGNRSKITQYIKTGPRIDYLFDYAMDGNSRYSYIYEQFNTISLGWIISVGFTRKDSFIVEVEYNPDLTYSVNH